jgi:predicted dehydrogenase
MSTKTRTLSAAVLGLGQMGTAHVESAKASPYIEKVIGYDPNEEVALECGKQSGISTTTDLKSILSDRSIELVYIACPNEFHCEMTIASLKAGKNVLCEKPMGTTLEEARSMLQAEKEAVGFLTIDFECRYSKMYTTVKDWIDRGLIGRPLNTHCDYFCCEFHMKNSWRSNHPGTLIAEKLCHYLDLAKWWFDDEVVEVISMSAPNFVTYFNHPDNHQITFKFKNGGVSSLGFIMGVAESFDGDALTDVIEKQAEDGHRLSHMTYGSKGAFEANVFRRTIRRWEFTDAPDNLRSQIVETITFTKDEDKLWFHNTHGHIIKVSELVAKGQPPLISAEDAFDTMKLVFAAEMSERENRVVRLSEI